ncbi:uncharacterized protein LOC113295240 [Papaver somniferum]|uniref:uncharacterized protein LOC113295240 n=1 Tax=Papaver somniferum TaxID=3469 RepID=UPI000E703197|nr:uncharacterized protein LOC113295240 [Papaver somniferum]
MVIRNASLTHKINIWLFWSNSIVTPSVVSISSQMITVAVGDVLVSGVHANVNMVQRRFLWSEMQLISDLKKPWLVIGDFNAILSLEDKVGDRSPSRRSMLDFSECLNDCELIQAPKRMWLEHPGFMKVVEDCWAETVNGDPAFILLYKLKKLKEILKEWNWSSFGNVQVKIKEEEKLVQEKMVISDNNPQDEQVLADLVLAQNDLNSKEVQQCIMLKQKSRVEWVTEGYANTNFFHINMKIKQSKNMIYEIEDNDGNMLQDVSINDSLLDVIPNLVTAEDQQMSEAAPELEEIKNVVFNMNADGAPGPDSFSCIFYKSC